MPTYNTSPSGSNVNNPLPSTKKTTTTPTSKKTTTPAGPTLLKQPVFDKRMRTLSWPMQGGVPGTAQQDFGGGPTELYRGMIVWDKATPYSSVPEMDFLFNPTTVTASYDMDATDVSTSVLFRAPGDTAAATYAMNQSVSLSLYFDRTFELWGSYDSSGTPLAKPTGTTGANGKGGITSLYDLMDATVYGVDVDILAMKQITGQLATQYGAAPSGQSTKGYVPGISEQGVMTMTPAWMFIGPIDTGLSYYGYVSDFTVTVTHFTQWMVPQRCIIDLDFALLIPPASEPGGPSFTDWMTLAEVQQDTGSTGKFII